MNRVVDYLSPKLLFKMDNVLQYKGYYGNVHFSSDDEVFYGQIIGINDLVNFESDSVKGLKRAFKEAVEEYMETCKNLGKEPDKTYKGSFNIRIPTQMHKEAALMAAIKNITLNDFVKLAIDDTLQREKEKVEISAAN